MYSKTTPKVIMHGTCYKKHVLSMTMVIRIELRISDQIVTSVNFDIENGNTPPNAGTLETIVWQTASLAKLPPRGFLFIHEI